MDFVLNYHFLISCIVSKISTVFLNVPSPAAAINIKKTLQRFNNINYGCHDLLELKTCLYEHGTMRIFRRMMKSYFFSICEDARCRQTTRYSHYARQTRN